jgi:glycerol kinase
VEHNPLRILRSAELALSRLLEGIDPGAAGPIGIATQRSTCLFWERKTGAPLTPALSWQDRRAEEICRSLGRHAALIRRKTGLWLSPHYAAGKLRWLLDRDPALRRRAERGEVLGGTLDAFLLHNLAGGASVATDPTEAARTLLMDLGWRDWDPALCDLFGIPPAALPPIQPSARSAGVARLRGRSLPILATLGDQQAALLGLGCLREGEAAVNYGTGAFVVLHTGRRPRRAAGLLTSVAWSTASGAAYLLEGTINAAGSAVDWIRDRCGIRGLPPSARFGFEDLPVVVPAFSGLGAPHWASSARAALGRIDLRARSEELLAGTLAGIACRVREILERMEGSGARVRRIVAGGGLAAAFPLLLRMQASLLGRTLFRSRETEGTVRGAALLALAGSAGTEPGQDRRIAFPVSPVRPGRVDGQAERHYRRFRRELRRVLAEAGSPRRPR